MSRKFTVTELARLAFTAEETFNDFFNRYVYSGSIDSYGDEIKNFAVVSGISCGFQITRGYKVVRGQIVQVGYDAELRISLNQDLDSRDRVEVNSVVYSIDGIDIGRSVKNITLMKLDN